MPFVLEEGEECCRKSGNGTAGGCFSDVLHATMIRAAYQWPLSHAGYMMSQPLAAL